MTLAHGTDHIESQRLVLRRITEDDLPFYIRIHANPRVAQYLSHGLPRTADESFAWLRATLASYADFELGQLAVVRKDDGVLVGRCGTGDFAVESAPAPGTMRRGWFNRAQGPAGAPFEIEPELGYTFDEVHWGNGYASEAARCVFDYVREVRRLPRVVSTIHPDNTRSQKVAARFGLRRDGSVEVSGRVLDRYLWPMQS